MSAQEIFKDRMSLDVGRQIIGYENLTKEESWEMGKKILSDANVPSIFKEFCQVISHNYPDAYIVPANKRGYLPNQERLSVDEDYLYNLRIDGSVEVTMRWDFKKSKGEFGLNRDDGYMYKEISVMADRLGGWVLIRGRDGQEVQLVAGLKTEDGQNSLKRAIGFACEEPLERFEYLLGDFSRVNKKAIR